MNEALLTDIQKILGEGAIVSAKSVCDNVRQVIPTTPAVDIGISGGIPEGSTTVITGIPKAGKTTLVLHIIANAQKPEYGSRNGYYFDVEGRVKEMNLQACEALDKEKLHVIKSFRDTDTGEVKVLMAEEILDSVIAILKNDPGCVVVIDSIAALLAKSEAILNIGDFGKRATVPTLLSQFFNQVGQILPVNRNLLILVSHIMANPSGRGKATMEKGGYGKDYQADVKLEAKWVEKITVGAAENGKVIGQICHWQVLCSALGAPFQDVAMRIRFGKGIDESSELVNIAISYGLIKKAGSWLTITCLGDEVGEVKAQGLEKMIDLINEKPEIKSLLHTKIREFFG